MNKLYKMESIDFSTSVSKKDLSPYDPSYPIVLLSDGLKTGIREAENTVKDIYNAVVKRAPIGTQISQIKKGSRLIVDVSDATVKNKVGRN